jgi:hypothetical protein
MDIVAQLADIFAKAGGFGLAAVFAYMYWKKDEALSDLQAELRESLVNTTTELVKATVEQNLLSTQQNALTTQQVAELTKVREGIDRLQQQQRPQP